MSKNNTQQPEPDPVLNRLEILIGTWSIKGHTLDSKTNSDTFPSPVCSSLAEVLIPTDMIPGART